MEFNQFRASLDLMERSSCTNTAITELLATVDGGVKSSCVSRYIMTKADEKDSVPFLARVAVRSDTELDESTLLQLARHLRAFSDADTELFAALRIGAGGQHASIIRLFRELIEDCAVEDIQPELLSVFPEVKLKDPQLFLRCLKRCARLVDASLSTVVSAGICDLPPQKDEDIAIFVNIALESLDDVEWLNSVNDDRLLDIFAGLLSLAAIMLNVGLIQKTVSFLLRSFHHRTPSNAVVRVLATPYTMWMREVVDLMPNIDDVYRSEMMNVDSTAPIQMVCKQMSDLVFVRQQHLAMNVHHAVLKQQKWRDYRGLRKHRLRKKLNQ